ncbi:phage tail tape measure protein [Vibrio europaeus]|uniref:Phage tail tape measure protein n=1 Tax=Vibrio europaeus TaxID=300876 RepID=A0ABT5GNE3_9VIBR|nr:phage tail tape measure protein [Vibrio europaeus]MDC5723082.1 phage tail tape measure protein [Vibrio europaeus]MDC5728039.1 phage tail tape measure protein [Vibrio europaeus]MDC5733342.1 phage tail tape measure protein [Vibrio europaeus]MDC5738619.1 phage tail tape measure protein [Vibrio europaeus]MDC5743819.1 phage tail tape measure protein [Vibrio europaeus]
MADNKQKFSIVLDGVNRLSAPLAAAGKTIRKLETDTSSANNELKKFESQQKQIGQYQGMQTNLQKTRGEMQAAKVASAGLSQELNQNRAALKGQEKELEAARVKLAGLRSETEKSEKVSKAQRAELRQAEQQVRQLDKAYAAQVKQVGSLDNQLRRADRQVDKVSKQFADQSAKAGQLRKQLSSAGLNVDALGAEQLRLARQTKSATAALDKQKQSLKELNAIQARKQARSAERGELAGQAVGTIVAAAPLAAAGKRAVDYQSAFIDVRKVVDFESAEQEAAFQQKMKALAVNTGMSQIGMAEIVASAGRSGIKGEDNLLKFAVQAAEMAIAFDVTEAEAGNTLARFQSTMGLEGDRALGLAKTSNLLADNLANTEAKDVAAVLARQGSTAMMAGLNEFEAAALAGSLFSVEGSEEVASTALKNITGALTKGFAATGSQKEAYAMLGLDANSVAAGMQEDATGTLLEVFKAIEDADDVDRGAIISQLVGEEAKGAVGKLVNTMHGEQGLINTLERASSSSKAASAWQGELDKRRKSSQYLLDQSASSLDRLVTAFGNGFIPIIEVAAPMVTTVANALASGLEAYPEAATGIMAVTGGFIALKTAMIGWKLGKNLLGAGKDFLGEKKLTSSLSGTKNAADRASNSIDRLNRKLGGLGGGAGGYSGRRSGKSGRVASSGRRLGRNKWARRIGFLTGATALTMAPSAAMAADTLTMGGDLIDGVGGLAGLAPKAGMLAKAGSFAGKLVRPLSVVAGSIGLVDAIKNGDAADVGSAAGDVTGGLGGAMAGAALGSMILPGIGTAIGGMIGGIGGGTLGEWVGAKVGGWFGSDKTDIPASGNEQRQLTQLANASSTNQDNRKINIEVKVEPTGNPEYDQRMGEDVAQKTAMAVANVAPPDYDVALGTTLGDVS